MKWHSKAAVVVMGLDPMVLSQVLVCMCYLMAFDSRPCSSSHASGHLYATCVLLLQEHQVLTLPVSHSL